MTTPAPSAWGFGARTAHQGTNVPTHGDGMGSSTTPSSAAPRQVCSVLFLNSDRTLDSPQKWSGVPRYTVIQVIVRC